jgi:hypothetical protein
MPRGAKRGHHVAKKFVRMVGPIFAPVGQIDAKFAFTELSWPNTDYKRDPQSHDGAAKKCGNTQ